jgi:hypothetical protein
MYFFSDSYSAFADQTEQIGTIMLHGITFSQHGLSIQTLPCKGKIIYYNAYRE